MPHTLTITTRHNLMIAAGVAYLVIIFFGISADMVLRPMALATADLTERVGYLRLGLVFDALMVAADAALAILLFLAFRHVSPNEALAAMIFRLIQGGIIGASLMAQIAAIHLPEQAPVLMAIGADGYDLGLLFFAVNTVLMARILCHSGLTPKWLPPALFGAAVVYAVGSLSALLAPAVADLIEPAYVLPLIAETGFCLWLLFGHRNMRGAVA
ncbi:DUF4386 domain-containing protein [Celeribacter litoreus]|uniref:DUF4386 domain-containing protein n=1 Tax=Celeribacter litoreus TaxID=2876714 RepID=UPI001CCBED1B|nr:DUF4386 domain-containing protein [Celeribacter litoreus]MCA0043033.1 DUF4386 domain-containing protein [Celeribacter litoreus]